MPPPAYQTNDPNSQYTNSGDGSFNWGSMISPAIGAAGSVVGSGQLKNGIGAANAQQQQTYQQIAGIYQPQYQVGTGADASLASALGIGGAAPNYAAFENTPGYQFALQQGDQAINRQAAASGNAYNSSTLAALGQYNQGLANQTYQSYVQNLLSTAGLGNQAAQGMATARYNTGANIGQGLANIGAANMSGVQGFAQSLAGPAGSFVNSLFRGGSAGGGNGYSPGGTPGQYWSGPSGNDLAGSGMGTPSLGGYIDPNTGLPAGSSFNPDIGSQTGDWTGLGGYTNPSAAGGEAATGTNSSGVAPQVASDAQSTNNASFAGYSTGNPNSSGVSLGDISKAAGEVGNGLAIYQGLQRGGLTGYGSAAVNAGSLANKLGAFGGSSSAVGGALGAAGGALGLYNGLKQGGALGYTNAALGAANTLSGIGTLAGGATAGGLGALSTIGAFAGPLGIALAPVLMGMSQPPWVKNSDYNSRMQAYLNAGPGQFASTGGFNGTYWDPQYTNYMAAQQALSGTDWTSLVNSGAVPFAPGVTGGGGGNKNTSNK